MKTAEKAKAQELVVAIRGCGRCYRLHARGLGPCPDHAPKYDDEGNEISEDA